MKSRLERVADVLRYEGLTDFERWYAEQWIVGRIENLVLRHVFYPSDPTEVERPWAYR